MLLFLEGRIIQNFQLLPKVLIELLQSRVSAFLKIVEESFLQDADCVFYRRFEFRFSYFCRKNYCMIMLCPFGIILIEFRLDPILIRNHGLLAVITYNNGRDASKGFQSVVLTSIHCISFVDSIPSA